MKPFVHLLSRLVLIIALIIAPQTPAFADLRSAPVWYDQNAVAVTPDWHYRVAINVPAGASVNSTVQVDVDFAVLLSNLGVSGTFDSNSPRVVRSTGALSTNQEFTDTVFGGVTDSAGNARGEVRFILQDAGAVTYTLYFDVTQNGAKPANPQTPINGNFEVGTTGTATPIGWTAPTKANANFDAQMRPVESVSVTSSGTVLDGVNPRTVSGNPNSGAFSYLYGWRSVAGAQTAGNPGVTFSRSFTVPATNPGSITFRYRVGGWDATGFDTTRIDLVNSGGTVLVEMVGPTAGSYITKPFSPNSGNAAVTNTTPGYGSYNGYDCGLNNVHTLGMTVPCKSETWFTVTQSLATYAGQTITFRARSFNDTADPSWYQLDDVEWAVVAATLGTAQGFGVNITAPATGATFVPGQIVPITASVDANPTAATTPVTARLFDSAGAAISTPFTLFNDGTHGDAAAGDGIWTNNGSIVADAVTVPLSATTGAGYVLRVFGRDGSTSTISAQNGLIRGPGTGAAAETQANYWNIDEQSFNVQTAAVTLTKTSAAVSDPVNGGTNAKAIPGATVRYCLLVANAGPQSASNIIMTDAVPASTSYIAGSMRSGTTCASAATVEDDNNVGADESDPVGSSFSAGTVITITTAVANGGAVALTFDVLIN